MRGKEQHQEYLFSYINLEQRIPAQHPLRTIRAMVDPVLQALSPDFDALYAELGAPSIPPEQLLRALMVQVLYTIRSERILMEELDYNLLFRWFVGLSIDEPVWDHSVFSKNRDRLLAGEVARRFFEQVLVQARKHQLLSNEHFTVDGTLIEAWASYKSFQRKDPDPPSTATPPEPPAERPGHDTSGGSNPTVDFRGETRTNDTHASRTDPEARLYKKGAGDKVKLCFMGHLLMENRHGLAVGTSVSLATGTAERDEAYRLLEEMTCPPATGNARRRRCTAGGDKAFDTKEFVERLRGIAVTPHVTQNETNHRSSAIDGRTTRHPGYAISQGKRKRVEEIFGWIKTIGAMRKTRFKGTKRTGWFFTFAVACYNLVRMKNLLPDLVYSP